VTNTHIFSVHRKSDKNERFAGEQDFVGIGIIMSAIPERDRAVIIVPFPDGPAAEAGLQPRDNILAVDGEPILDDNGFLRDVVRGPEGSSVTLTIQTPGQAPREVTLTRRPISGAVPVPYQVLEAPDGKRVGYMLVPTLNDSTVGEQVKLALLEMTREAPLDGLILDNRQNLGGADSVLISLLSYFTGGRLGYFVSRDGQRPLEVVNEDVNGSQQLPLVVLVGPETASYGEVLSGVLQDVQRAYLIGETTGGNVETLSGYDFSDGSRAWIAHESFQPINHPQEDWELNGIVPDQVIPVNWDEVALQDDPAVLTAIDHLQNLSP
jgi:C-terminal peptidase prc